jgi:hypothetical protein
LADAYFDIPKEFRFGIRRVILMATGDIYGMTGAIARGLLESAACFPGGNCGENPNRRSRHEGRRRRACGKFKVLFQWSRF